MGTVSDQDIKRVIQEVLDERFVHSLSDLTYNSISSLWHIDRESEEYIAYIASKVICGIFCIKYLSHIDRLLKKRLKIKDLTARDLPKKELIQSIRKNLHKEKELQGILKRTLPILRRLLEAVDARDLERLTQIAHTGDYLLSSLEDLRDAGSLDYTLWLEAVPHYYEKDLVHIGAVRTREYIPKIEQFIERSWQKQVPVEIFNLNTKALGNRINLNTYFASEEGFFPCSTTKSLDKRKD